MYLCGYMAVWLRGYVAMWLCGYVATWLCGHMAMWLCGCVAMWLCGYVAMWLCGCVAVWLCGGRACTYPAVSPWLAPGSGSRWAPTRWRGPVHVELQAPGCCGHHPPWAWRLASPSAANHRYTHTRCRCTHTHVTAAIRATQPQPHTHGHTHSDTQIHRHTYPWPHAPDQVAFEAAQHPHYGLRPPWLAARYRWKALLPWRRETPAR